MTDRENVAEQAVREDRPPVFTSIHQLIDTEKGQTEPKRAARSGQP